ncbi:MAG: ABC transporter permease [Atribacterota bacterium]
MGSERKSSGSWLRYILENYGLLLGFIFLCVFLSIASPYFLTLGNVFNVGRQIAVTAIVAFGMTFVITAAQIDLSVGSVTALTGVTAAAMLQKENLPPGLWILAVLAIGLLVGMMHGYFVSKQKIPAFLLTLATMGILRGIGFIYTEGRPIYIKSESFRAIGRGFVGTVPTPVIIMLVIWVFCYFIFTQTKIGKYVSVAGENPEVARVSGINVDKILMFVFIFQGILGAIGGIVMASRLGTGSPQVGAGEEMDVVSAVILGGTNLFGGEGRMFGTLLGAMVIGTLMNGMTLLDVSPYVQMVIRGLVILGAVWMNMLRYRARR